MPAESSNSPNGTRTGRLDGPAAALILSKARINTATLELLGGVLLALGIAVRWVAATLVPVMIGALLVHLPNGWMFTAPHGGWDYVAFLIAALTAQALLGPGAWAVKIGPPATPSQSA